MIDVTEEIQECINSGTYPDDNATFYNGRSADTFEDAISSGFRIIAPASNELFIDIDSEEALKKHEMLVTIFNENFKLLKLRSKTESKTPGHWHFVYTLPEGESPEERIKWQCFLGSDPVKEALSLVRIQYDVIYPVLFFERR